MYAATMISGTRLKAAALGLATWWLVALANAALPDGPYVLPAEAGWQSLSVDVSGDEPRKQVSALAPDATISIAAVGDVPAFQVKLRAPSAIAADTVVTARGAPLFVVADTHGEYEILVAMLRAHKVIGSDLGWRFARGHLVVLGDVFDRGPNQLEILWLLYQLEAEAAAAGGGVHFVIGNHEAMMLGGDLRYLHAKYADTARVLGVAKYPELFSRESLLGQWLRTRPAMLLVNDQLCVHAGISRALVDSRLTLRDVNDAVRSVLASDEEQGAVAQLVMGSFGPLWYRGYFPGQRGFPPASAADLRLALETYGARRMLIGHTIVPTITPLYDGRVIAVQVPPRRDENGHANFESLLVRKGEYWRATLDGKLQRLAVAPAATTGK